uniref:Uncharacterized protein n=1 Tax=Meloidogyne enterolobii TaxID=390850 RepID=A0A6V7UD63_MELEN|nr:unnamed protein product [Meloidogyne enterolobii]
MLRAQRFDVSRFDGKTYFSTPFDFELIVQPNSKYYLVERVAKSVDSFTDMKIGEFYNECLELHASVQKICINTDFVLCPFDKPLKTPVKRKSEEVETIEVDIKSQKK